MKLRYVTLTGADDKTDLQGMGELSKEFPYAEWAILFSQKKSGVPRYPSLDWVQKLGQLTGYNLSAHLCGKWVDDVNRGHFTFLDDDSIVGFFSRIQLNMSGDRLGKVLAFETKLWEAGLQSGPPVILGGPYQKYQMPIPTDSFLLHEVSPLFDCSGGKGILTKDWPAPVVDEYNKPLFCGYAGGLGPENIEEQLEKIAAVVGDAEIWIDMESKLRNKNDEFDLEYCCKVLEITRKWT